MFTIDRKKHTYMFNSKTIPSVTQILNSEGLIEKHMDNKALAWYMLKGKYLHQTIEMYLQGNLDEDNLDPRLDIAGFKKFLTESDLNISGYETPYYHPQYLYAGTPDLWGVLDGKMTVIDIKSGSPAKWHALQLAAYVELMRGYGINIQTRANLYLNGEKYKFVPLPVIDLQKDLSVFLSALTVYQWKINNNVNKED